MTRFLSLISVLAILAGSTASGAERFDAATWAGVETYDVSALRKLDRFKVGQLIGIKFNYRHERIRHPKPNWYQGSLWAYTPTAKEKFSFVQVMVPKSALPAFKAITTDVRAEGNSVAYGQILQDAEATKFRFVRLLGTKAERDPAGNTTVGW